MKIHHLFNLHFPHFAFVHFGHGGGAGAIGVLMIAVSGLVIVTAVFSARGK
jgi:hypothetical protein